MKLLPPLQNFYTDKRKTCYRSVRSFKYPFTRISYVLAPIVWTITGWVTDFITTIRLYEMSYVAVRTIDDIADEGNPEQGLDHLQSVVDFLVTSRDADNESEALLQYILDASALLGRNTETIRSSFECIFATVRDDAQRRFEFQKRNPIIRNQQEIETYIHDMEYRGIFRLIFTLFNENEKNWEHFWPLVRAGRLHFYLLRDVVEDVANGLINIPAEHLPDDVDELISSAYC